MNIGWLTFLLLLPFVGALVTMAVPKASGLLAKQVSLGFSLATLALTLVITVGYHRNGAADYEETHTWIEAFGAHYALGLDGVGLVLIVLTALLTPIVQLASWNDAKGGRWSEKSFFAWILALEVLSLGVFAATDVFLFYVLFEATLIPMYFLIGGFGGAQRSYAAVKFLLYSLLGGLLMLASVVGLYVVSAKSGEPSYLLTDLIKVDMSQNTERWLFLGFFFAFAVKAPMVPFHTWLPDAAAEATPGTSVLLVGILDKIGTFGMIRFCLGLFPNASEWATPVVLVLALISVLYGALVAIGQTDIKRLIAYTSISHFGFIVMGIFALTSQGMTGSTLYMFNHGLSTAALFLVAGYLISRRGSARIADYGGVEKVAPVLAGTFLFAGLSSLALPGLSPFISEFMVLAGTFSRHKVIAVVAVLGIVLAALYILIMYQRLMTGPVRDGIEKLKDLNAREVLAIAPLALLIVGFGIYPKPVVDIIKPAVESTMQRVGVTDKAPEIPVTEGQK
ncbi:proton-translocating NADH-quinone oxidoreductase, chain M [Kribbella flavida DSM 17836]|uniref:Proton-translocating NADH-quinone oxidoreductase, chain M n=1 Tax=Kribbella flavida (strain DSM 17836 / JCM 10339 / NBRC 14399) TaxID=479435 RepID=D2PVP9_KRIFD|nr:NADH-quinone oxidoreductase subunit M [Kribbella flavida]ADB35289.1 proton-translocating NADH-quinone oxidoreductase, chain M [Kribbella flavida DSM 17836]